MARPAWMTTFVLCCLAGAFLLTCATLLSPILLPVPAGVTAAAPPEHTGQTFLLAGLMSALALLTVMAFAAGGSGQRTGRGIKDLATFLTENPDPVMRIATGGEVLYANPAGLALLHELGGDVGHPAPERWQQALQRVLASGRREAFDEEHDGRAFSIWAVPVAERGYVNLYAHDVADRKRAEAEVHRLATAARDSNDAITVEDFDGHILAWNRGAERMYGWSKAEALGMNIRDMIPDGDHEGMSAQVARVREGQAVPPFEAQRVTKDGRILHIWVTLTVLWDEAGRPVGIAATERDVTERKQAEEALRLSEVRHRRLLDQLCEGVWAIDENAVTTFVNERMAEMLGYTKQEMLGRSLFDCIEEGARETCKALLARRRWDVREQHDVELLGKNGTRLTATVAASPIVDERGNVCGAVAGVTDISDRKRAAEERERLIAELAAKNRELEQFTYTVSHDLKSPLITIKGFASLLAKGIADGNAEEVASDLDRIKKAADRMHQLLDELLELSRSGRLVNPPRDVPLSDLAREAAELVAIRIAESGIEVAIPPDLPVVRGDRPRLLSAMQNLLDNAAKFVGGQPEPRVEIGARQDGDETVCWVRDNGIGIDPRYHERVFGLFDRLDSVSREGTGIGLAIAKRIVEAHGGRIWVESEGRGRGATFYFSIPRKGGLGNGTDENS